MALLQIFALLGTASGQDLFMRSRSAACSAVIHANTKCTTKNVYNNTKEADQDSCCARCDEETQCVQWTYHPATRSCDRVASAEGMMHLKSAVCGVKGSTPGPSPSPPTPPGHKKPNIIFFLTDDQDQVLGGSFPHTTENAATPLPKTKELFAKQGTTGASFYIHTPICCPSRAETLTGRYLQNVHEPPKDKQCEAAYGGHDDAGNLCCMHVDEVLVNNATFARYLQQEAGYTVGMFGKYLNTVPDEVPIGYDTWFANGGGSYFAPSFKVKNVDGLKDGTWKGKKSDYSTSVIGNQSVAWIRKVAKGSKPFFAYIGTKAPHGPFTPAKWYADHWDKSWPATAPRPPSFNLTKSQIANHHPTVASQSSPLSDSDVSCIDNVFMERWRCLMSVDDLIAEVIHTVEELGISNSTYFFYSSDHGFQLGELNLPYDKRNVYEFDTKIHLLAKGPGIPAGSQWTEIATNVDLAPTWLAIAGVQQPATMDGRSLLPLIVEKDTKDTLPSTVHEYLSAVDVTQYKSSWRKGTYFSHYSVGAGSYCSAGHHIDQPDNNFIAVRYHADSPYGNILYAEFQWANGTNYGTGNVDFMSPFFFEYYDMDTDPWQMHNIFEKINKTNPARIEALHKEVHAWHKCKGSSCL